MCASVALVDSYTSHFDKSKIIDRLNWGVTLIASKGSGFSKHHAQLLVETVKKSGEYHKLIIDFVGGGSSHSDHIKRIGGSSWCSLGFGKIGRVNI